MERVSSVFFGLSGAVIIFTSFKDPQWFLVGVALFILANQHADRADRNENK